MQTDKDIERAVRLAHEKESIVKPFNGPAVLVNKNVDVVAINKPALDFFEQRERDSLGNPLGQTFRCLNQYGENERCGEGTFCRHCIIRNTAYEVFKTLKGVADRGTDVVLVFPKQKDHKVLRVNFSMNPVTLSDGQYVLVLVKTVKPLNTDVEHRLKEVAWMKTYFHNYSFIRIPLDISETARKALAPAASNRDIIMNLLGENILEGVALTHLDNTGIFFAICEGDGKLAFAMADRGWTRFSLETTHKLLSEKSGEEVGEADLWRFVRHRLQQVVRTVRRADEGVDIPLAYNIRLLAYPIWTRSVFAGALLLAYVPKYPHRDSMAELAETFGYSLVRLKRESNPGSCTASSPATIAKAKPRLGASAMLMGSLLETMIVEEERTKLSNRFRRSQFQQAQKLESVGRLASGIAHDFNNVIQSILGFGELLKEDIAEGRTDDIGMFTDEIIASSKRAATLTSQLLSFTRQQSNSSQTIDLVMSIANAVKTLRRIIGQNIEIDWVPPSGHERDVHINPSLLNIVFMNMIVNARDAIGKKKDGKIIVRIDDARAEEISTLREGASGKHRVYYKISIRDNGCGMDEKTIKRIFDPFFTTKSEGKGTGLGLANSRWIIKQAGGAIEVASKKGQGTNFSIYLPGVAKKVHPGLTDVMKAKNLEDNHNVTVMLTGDVDQLGIIACRLISMGYRVLMATSCRTALDEADDMDGKIDLLVTSPSLRDGSGKKLWRDLAAKCPGIRCLFVAATLENVPDAKQLGSRGAFLCKPFTGAELTSTIGKLMKNHDEK